MSVGALVFVTVLSVMAAFAINGPTPEAVRHLTILVFLGPPLIYTFLYTPVSIGAAKALLKDDGITWSDLFTSIFPSGFLGVALAEVVAAALTFVVVAEHASRQAVIAQLFVVTAIWGALSAYIGARLAWTKYARLNGAVTQAKTDNGSELADADEAVSEDDSPGEDVDKPKTVSQPRNKAQSELPSLKDGRGDGKRQD